MVNRNNFFNYAIDGRAEAPDIISRFNEIFTDHQNVKFIIRTVISNVVCAKFCKFKSAQASECILLLICLPNVQ